jgi:hypothetical protein
MSSNKIIALQHDLSDPEGDALLDAVSQEIRSKVQPCVHMTLGIRKTTSKVRSLHPPK